jgi:4-amino-4-deoxy-L-arabinose transferase-like glycosyltransferase
VISFSDRRSALLCACAVFAAIAFTVPIAESGVNDDWSYVKTARDLAQTGELIYNGWSAAMLGAQAYWGALFIKLFGFSFFAVRMSVALLAGGCAALLYALHRRARLPAGLALFGGLTIVLSAVFIPNATSFMTDVPALFLLLVSIYGYVRVAELLEAADAAAVRWGRAMVVAFL